ncbi:MAG TPA: SRPBCC domain-containing protein [Acidimicrobiia bacterium]|jgi:uncharacterized protein YndB with AHSA1/START domain
MTHVTVFTLEPEGEGTRLRVVESGLETTSWPPSEQTEYAEDHRRGWATCFDRLVALIGTLAE